MKQIVLCLWCVTSTLLSHNLAIAGLFRDEAPYLKEWIEYHLLVGVEHFWLYNDQSNDEWKEVLTPYIDQGIVEVFDWPIPPDPFSSYIPFVPYQIAAYEDAFKKAKAEKTRWLALIDIDEFILPLEGQTVTECLENNFSNAAAIFINWRNFGTSGLYLEKGEPLLPNLTACSDELHSRNGQGKSIVRPDFIEEVWNPHFFVPKQGHIYFNGDGEPMKMDETGPIVNGEQHYEYFVLNHYFTKDENFFQTVRRKRQEAFRVEDWLTEQLYYDFNEDRDEKIISFIRTKHPEWAKKHWKEEKPIVSAEIYGRLGNNLFQVAAASALAWDHGARAVFPGFVTSSKQFEHLFFRCDTSPFDPAFVWNEPTYTYAPIPYLPDLKIIGYFQSEKHFAHYRDRLLRLFAPHPKDLEYIRKKYYWLEDCLETVGVQIRYYKKEFPTETIYPQYGKAYLEKALRQFDPSSIFLVSSDNLDFAKQSLPSWAENVIFLEGEEDYIDFFLLSQCKHNVITNSTFGWWSAWLNQNLEKKIVCPALWMKDCPSINVCPESWIQIETEYD